MMPNNTYKIVGTTFDAYTEAGIVGMLDAFLASSSEFGFVVNLEVCDACNDYKYGLCDHTYIVVFSNVDVSYISLILTFFANEDIRLDKVESC